MNNGVNWRNFLIAKNSKYFYAAHHRRFDRETYSPVNIEVKNPITLHAMRIKR